MLDIQIKVHNAHHDYVTDSDQKVWVRWNGTDFIAQAQGNFYRSSVPDTIRGTVEILVQNPRYFEFALSFEVSFNDRLQLTAWKKIGGGLGYAVAFDDNRIDSFVYISKMQQVDTKADPLKIARPEGPNWYHKQTDDKGEFERGTEFPLIKIKDPILSPEDSTIGAKRLVYEVQSPVRPSGKIYVFEYKTVTSPKLVMVWHTDQMDFSKINPAGASHQIPYHFYFHPTAHSNVAYPYGKDEGGGQPHIGVGYRHLLFESWGSVQHYYSMKKIVFVVPIASLAHQFGEAGTSLGIFTILREINLAIHTANNADVINFMTQDVGRVAISGFSAGANPMISALSNRTSPLGQVFMQRYVKEIYSWDGAIGGATKDGTSIPNTIPQNFGQLIQQWWRGEDQYFRVYTSNANYDTSLSFMNKFAAPVRPGAAGSYCKMYYKGNVNFGTLVVLPDGFFKHNYKKRRIAKDREILVDEPLKIYRHEQVDKDDPGFPSYGDTHHWFFKVFMYHALTKGKFP